MRRIKAKTKRQAYKIGYNRGYRAGIEQGKVKRVKSDAASSTSVIPVATDTVSKFYHDGYKVAVSNLVEQILESRR